MNITLYTPNYFEFTNSDLSLYSIEKKQYLIQRLAEFVDSCRIILSNRLQQNCFKTGKTIFIGSCPFDIFNWYFSKQPNCNRTSRTLYQTRDGLRVPTKRFYYKWKNCLPNLMGGSNWYIRDHNNGNGNFSSRCRSFYTSVTLIISEEDYRVWANYTQVSQAQWFDNNSQSWYDV